MTVPSMNRPTPLILGLTNPYSTRPVDALVARPRHSAGWRLYEMLRAVHDSISTADYERAFRRMNVRDRQFTLRIHAPVNTTVLVLGHEVREYLNKKLSKNIEKVFLHPQHIDGVNWRMLPHPSGRSIPYNDPTTRTLVGLLLLDLYRGEY